MNNKEHFFLNKLLEDSSFANWAKGVNNNDIEYWNNWINNNPNYIDEVETAKAIILGIQFQQQLPNEQKVDDELSKILPLLKEESSELRSFSSKNRFKTFISLASAAIVLFMITWSGFQLYANFNTTVHRTNYGEIIDLKLPDGTTVVLNGNSEIKYKNNNTRNIYLQGEAYFKVKSIPATNAKFWVHTNDLKVEVLGTQFHVNTRKKNTKVVLDEGSIHLEFNNGDVKKMIPGELVSFSEDDKKLVHKKVSTETSYSLWKDGTYSFNETSLQEVMLNIEYTYGVKVEFDSPELKKLIITGGIPNQNLTICISAIEMVTGTRIIHRDNTLFIQKNLNN